MGIAADKLKQIFEPFTQVDGSFTRRHDGTGLGLAICRRLCDLMGGSLTVRSAPGPRDRVHPASATRLRSCYGAEHG